MDTITIMSCWNFPVCLGISFPVRGKSMKRFGLFAFISCAALLVSGCCCGPYAGGCFPCGPAYSPCATTCDSCGCDPCGCNPCAAGSCFTGGLVYNMANRGCLGGGLTGPGYVPENCPATAATSSDLSSCGGCGTCSSCGMGSVGCAPCNACEPCGPVYGPACGPCVPCAPACGPCPLLNIVCLPFAIVERLWNCCPGYWPNTGCSTIYYGDWINDPPCLNDPCSFDSYAGPCSKRACGANACGYDCCGSSGYTGGCSTCGDAYSGMPMETIQDGSIQGEVIQAPGTPTPAVAPNQVQPAAPAAAAPAANPQAYRSNCKNCQQNYQARVSATPSQMLTAYQSGQRVKTFPTTRVNTVPMNNGQMNNGQMVRLSNGQIVRVQQPAQQPVQQVSYVQPSGQQVVNMPAVQNKAPMNNAGQIVGSGPIVNQTNHQIPQNVLASLPKGAVIISDEVVSVQNGTSASAPAFSQANAAVQSNVAAVAQTAQPIQAAATATTARPTNSNAATRNQWKSASIKPQTYR